MTDESKNTETTAKAGGETEAPKMVPQDEVDRIISERLARERAKYSDYDDLRKKAETLEAKEKERAEKELSAQELLKQKQQEWEKERETLSGYKEKWSAYEERQKAAVEEAVKDLTDDDRAIVEALPLDKQMAAVNRLKAAANKPPIPAGKGERGPDIFNRPAKSKADVHAKLDAWRERNGIRD